MRFARIASIGVLTLPFLACGSDGGDADADKNLGGEPGPFAQVTEVALDQNRGALHGEVYRLPMSTDTIRFASGSDEFYYVELPGDDHGLRISRRARQPLPTNVIIPHPTIEQSSSVVWTKDIPDTLPNGEAGSFNTAGTLAFPLADGGLAFLSTTPAFHTFVRVFDAAGNVRLDAIVQDFLDLKSWIPLPDGGFAGIVNVQPPAAGSIETQTVRAAVVNFGPNGVERSRLTFTDLRLPDADSPGLGTEDRPPGTGRPVISAIAAMPDNGVDYVGAFELTRLVPCGDATKTHPRTPDAVECKGSQYGFVTFVGRADVSGRTVWEHRYGRAYLEPPPGLTNAAATPDGSLWLSGQINTGVFGNEPSDTLQGLLARFDKDGNRQFVHAIPFGKAPGVLALRGTTTIDTLIPRADGSTEAIFHAPDEPCRLLHVEPTGDVSRVQILEPGSGGCNVVVSPTTVGYAPRPTNAELVRLAD